MTTTLTISTSDGRFVATTDDPVVVRTAASLMRVPRAPASTVVEEAVSLGFDAALGLIAEGWE